MTGVRKSSLAALKRRLGWHKCRRCGACCRGRLIVEASGLDVLREPLIAELCPVLDGNGTVSDPARWEWSLSCGKPCPFLRADNGCRIYATRPDDCVAFEPSGAKCLQCRTDEELGRLRASGGQIENQKSKI